MHDFDEYVDEDNIEDVLNKILFFFMLFFAWFISVFGCYRNSWKRHLRR